MYYGVVKYNGATLQGVHYKGARSSSNKGLPFFQDTEKSDEIQNEDQPEPRMAHPHQPIPMPYCSLSPETAKVTSKTRKELQKTSPVVNSKKKNKNKKRKGPERTIKSGQTEVHSNHMSKKVANSVEEFPVYFW